MQTLHSLPLLRERVRAWRAAGERIYLVPTMGNLHAGHVALVERARQLMAERAGGRVVATVFVNPTQFGPNEDFAAYPRTLEADAERLSAAGTDLLFAPAVEEVYPHGSEGLCRVEVPGLSELLCGASRPGHFSGVATVVSKLFNMVQPDTALFGEKDWQQLLVIRRLVRDLDFPVEIVGVPTVREVDGLAMSSRNGYLSAEERAVAPRLHATLQYLVERLRDGDRVFGRLEAMAREELETAGFRPDYVSIRRADDLGPADGESRELVILAAAYLGRARLIDNVTLTL